MGATPLRRNRDFLLLQAGQLLSSAGSEAATIAYPLLVLALTGSPARAGVAGFARTLPYAVLFVPAGLAADRFDRRRLMIAADALRGVALVALTVVIVAGHPPFWSILAAALVEGVGSVVFTSASVGALRAVVPPPQLPDAVGAQTARSSIVNLIGPPLGGFLFGIARSLPFVADAFSYVASTVSLIAMRTPFQQPRAPARAGLRRDLAEGFRYLWDQRFLRTCAFLYGLGNFTLPGVFLVVIVAGRQEGLGGGRIGLLFALFGAFLLVGSILSGLARRRLSMRTIIQIELVSWLGTLAFVVWPDVYVLVVAILPQAVAMPITDSAVVGYRVAITPDHLLGRSESVRAAISWVLTPLGPLVAGLLLESYSPRQTIAAFTLVSVVLFVWGTVSPAIRHAPSLDELEGLT
ncbi:MAG TPA: MFS transporter [Gaiellales bacterium]